MTKWLIRAGVSAAVVAILLLLIPIDAVIDALRRTTVATWSTSVAIFFSGHYLNALKLRLLLGPGPGLTQTCVRAQYAGLVANLGLPGLAGGDLVRAAYLIPMTGLKRAATATIVDRLIDTSTMLVFIGTALVFAGVPSEVADLAVSAGLWLVGGAVIALLLGVMLLRSKRFAGVMKNITEAWTEMTTRGAAIGGAMVISLVVQSAFVMTNVWLARQVGVTTGLAAWFVAWPLSKLIAILPFSLGGIGVREAALVSLMALYGAPQEAVLASGILWQAILLITGLVGLIVTQLWPRTADA
jgi:uncharacterized membrane protein YbhN (UPF0104 family)